jgi:uncharacterized protein with HEPN domain
LIREERAAFRVRDIKEGIALIRRSLARKSIDDLREDPVLLAAFERFLEIISEASRHVPDEWKSAHGSDVPWREIVGIGNNLRHGYKKIELDRLWSIYADDLDVLETAVDAMIAARPVEGDDD